MKILRVGFLFLSFTWYSTIYAQNLTGLFIQAGSQNAELLGKAYLNPLFSGLGTGLGQGWASTAKVRTGHVDIKFLGGLTFIPSSEQTFDVSKLGLSSLIQISGSPITPAIIGNNNSNTTLDVNAINPSTGQTQNLVSLNLPGGAGINFVPTIIPQLSVGLPFQTEVSFRFLPKISVSDYQGNLFGAALKHEFSSLIPAFPLNISLLAGYTQIKLNYALSILPQNGNNVNATLYSGQTLELKSNNFTLGVLASKSISVLTGHVGINYSISSGQASTLGTYPIASLSTNGTPTTLNLVNPLSVSSDKLSNLSINGGFQIKLAFFEILGEGSLGKYSSVNGGIGFSF